MDELVKIYVDNVVQLHGILVTIVSNCDMQFASCFWKSLNEGFGNTLSLSTTFHPQTDG